MEKTMKKETNVLDFLKRNSYILSAVIVIVAFYLINHSFLSLYSIQNQLEELAPLLPMACGIGFVLYTGGIDLSIGAVASLVCVLTGTFVIYTGQWIIPMMVCFGLLIGLLNGFLVAFVKLPSFIVTLCAQSVYKAAAIIISGGKSNTIPIKQRYIVGWATEKLLKVPVIMWISVQETKALFSR